MSMTDPTGDSDLIGVDEEDWTGLDDYIRHARLRAMRQMDNHGKATECVRIEIRDGETIALTCVGCGGTFTNSSHQVGASTLRSYSTQMMRWRLPRVLSGVGLFRRSCAPKSGAHW